VIVAAVVAPHPPLLLRELCGERDPVPTLREACHEALRSALRCAPDTVLVLGGGDLTSAWPEDLPADVRSFGTTHAPPVAGLPQSLGVGKRLLEEVGWSGPTHLRTLAWDASPDDVARTADLATRQGARTVLLTLGDGSTRRGEKAPGYLDERAFAFDDAIAEALENGDAAALAGLDAGLAQDLMVLGRSTFATLGEAAARQGEPVEARTLYRDDPYGVAYTVALWLFA